MVTRRTTIVGLGGLLAGGGALISTGAFSTIEAERSVSLATAGDASAFLGLEILDEEHVDMTDGTIEFDIIADGRTVFDDLVNVRNNGTQAVTSLRFEFLVTGAVQDDDEVEEALKIVSGGATVEAIDEENLLVVSDAGDADDDQLTPGGAIPFGVEIDLTAVDIEGIDGDPDITLRIIADTGAVAGDPGDDPDPGNTVFEYDSTPTLDPSGTPPRSVRVEIINTGDSDAALAGFNIEIDPPGQSPPPDGFGGFDIDTPNGGSISGDGGSVGDDIFHLSYTVGPNETAEYIIEEFERDISSNAEIEFTLISTSETGSVRFELGTVAVQ